MNDFAVIDKLMKTVIDKRKITFCTVHNPVWHGISGQVNAIAFVSFGLSFQRKGIHIFPVDDRGNQSESGNTITEQNQRVLGSNDGAVIVFENVDMHMVFVHDKSLGNVMQTLMDFCRKLLVSIREFFEQFFL